MKRSAKNDRAVLRYIQEHGRCARHEIVAAGILPSKHICWRALQRLERNGALVSTRETVHCLGKSSEKSYSIAPVKEKPPAGLFNPTGTARDAHAAVAALGPSSVFDVLGYVEGYSYQCLLRDMNQLVVHGMLIVTRPWAGKTRRIFDIGPIPLPNCEPLRRRPPIVAQREVMGQVRDAKAPKFVAPLTLAGMVSQRLGQIAPTGAQPKEQA